MLNLKKLLTENIQEICETMKRPNIKIVGIEEGEKSQLKSPENSFNKILEETFLNLKKVMPKRYKKHTEYQIGGS